MDAELEERMERAERIVMLVRAMRVKSNLKVRQPLRRIILPVADEAERAAVHRMEEVILEEINVKAMEFVTDDSGIVHQAREAELQVDRSEIREVGPAGRRADQRDDRRGDRPA